MNQVGNETKAHQSGMRMSAQIFLAIAICAQSNFAGAELVKFANAEDIGVAGLGPGSVDAELVDIKAAKEKALLDWLDFSSLEENGLSLGADYNLLYQTLSSSTAEKDASGGVFRVFGSWKPNPESAPNSRLVFKVEHRHSLGGGLSPQLLLPQAGVAGVSGPTFSDVGGVLTNLF